MTNNLHNLEDFAYKHLAQQISEGRLKPKVIYSQTQMAKELGISRTPFRNALTRLEENRYIDVLPSRGFRLHEMTKEDITNTFMARCAVEGFCSLSIHRDRETEKGKKTILLLQDNLKDMANAVFHRHPYSEILELDAQFHDIIVSFCENQELLDLYNRYHHRLEYIAEKTFLQENRPAVALQEHQRIYDAIYKSSPHSVEKVYSAVYDHITNTRDIALSYLEEEEGGQVVADE